MRGVLTIQSKPCWLSVVCTLVEAEALSFSSERWRLPPMGTSGVPGALDLAGSSSPGASWSRLRVLRRGLHRLLWGAWLKLAKPWSQSREESKVQGLERRVLHWEPRQTLPRQPRRDRLLGVRGPGSLDVAHLGGRFGGGGEGRSLGDCSAHLKLQPPPPRGGGTWLAGDHRCGI